jgi:hypothetical protein
LTSLGSASLGLGALGSASLGLGALGSASLGLDVLGLDALGLDALGLDALGLDALGLVSLGLVSLGLDALGLGVGLVSLGRPSSVPLAATSLGRSSGVTAGRDTVAPPSRTALTRRPAGAKPATRDQGS